MCVLYHEQDADDNQGGYINFTEQHGAATYVYDACECGLSLKYQMLVCSCPYAFLLRACLSAQETFGVFQYWGRDVSTM